MTLSVNIIECPQIHAMSPCLVYLLGEERGDQEGELRNTFSTVGSSTMKYIAQHSLSILWGRIHDEGTEFILAYASSKLFVSCRTPR